MPTKLGNGGNSQENYDPVTGKYVSGDKVGSIDKTQLILGLNLSKVNMANMSKLNEKIVQKKKEQQSETYNMDSFKKKDREWKPIEDMQSVNPNHHTGRWEWENNCQRCSPTYVARRAWGLDVEARPCFNDDVVGYSRASALNPWSYDTVFSVYEGAQKVMCPSGRNESWAFLDSEMDKMPNGAICQVVVMGHTFVVERIDGRNVAIEPQAPERYYATGDIYGADSDHRGRYTVQFFARVDNLKPSRRFWGVCKNREDKKQ